MTPPTPGSTAARKSIFTRPLPQAVTYDLSIPDQATITLPPQSTWTSGAHWHETHTEYLQVLCGHAEIRLGDTTLQSVGPKDGVITVPRYAVHEWKRSNLDGLEDDLVVREWTDPKDGMKEVFFRSVNGLVLDAIRDGEGSWRMRTLELELMNLFWRADNWPVVLKSQWPPWVHSWATRFVLWAAVLLGWILGCKGIYPKYM
ncbi:hypothetical protein PM082_006560 [Marasmius tenuissimus]|nr:hypothetical protein PM082_006560 [Marasmius tenuissimus]